MKRFINASEDSVLETLAGFAAAHADLVAVRLASRVATRVAMPEGSKVGLVSGGGFGHEPTHFGFIGVGALDAACVGTVFSSPSVAQILETINAADSGVGVLLIVKNYAGDVMNFTVAAQETAVPLAVVFVSDDCSITPQPGRPPASPTGWDVPSSLRMWKMSEWPTTDLGPGCTVHSLERSVSVPLPSAPIEMLPMSPA